LVNPNQSTERPVGKQLAGRLPLLSNIKDERRRSDAATVALRVCIPRDDSE